MLIPPPEPAEFAVMEAESWIVTTLRKLLIPPPEPVAVLPVIEDDPLSVMSPS